MHDETLDKNNPALEKYILDTSKALKKHYGISEDRAVQLVGHAIQWDDSYPNPKEIIRKLDLITKKPITLMSEDEKLAMLALGHLVRKLPTFKSQTKNIGRNDPCPCESGLKFKKCCLSVAKANELQGYRHGGE